MQRINIYDIYADVCLPKHAHSQATQLAFQMSRHPGNSAPTIARPGAPSSSAWPQPCPLPLLLLLLLLLCLLALNTGLHMLC